MAAPRKKHADNEMLESDDNDIDGDSESSDMEVNETVQVEFEARVAEDCDFHGIKKLLQQLFLKANINLSEMANTIISQNYIGSVIKQVEDIEEEDSDEDDTGDIFGMLTVVNITERKETEWVSQLISYLNDRSTTKEKSTFKGDLCQQIGNPNISIGFIISERFVNIPAQLALPCYESLRKEITQAVKKKMNYTFDYYLLICKTYRMPAMLTKKKNKQKETEQISFVNQEEMLFAESCESCFEYCVASERDNVVGGKWDDDSDELIPYRTVLLVPASKLDDILTNMKSALTQT